MRTWNLLLATLLIISGLSTAEDDTGGLRQSAEKVGVLAARDLLSRKDYLQYHSDQFDGVHYAEAAAGIGALRFLAEGSQVKLQAAILQRYAAVPGTANLIAARHVDAAVWGVLPLQKYLLSGARADLQEGLALADAQWDHPLSNGLSPQTRFWIDDVWMMGALQVQAFRATGTPLYLDRAALEVSAYLERLQQPNGLFHHGPDAPFYWGRGNGWVAAGLAELLSELPPAHPRRASIEAAFVRMMEALVKYQSDTGMWRQLIDRADAWEESSATAMFGFALALGVEKKILKGEQFRASYRKAWRALAARVDDRGILRDICVGTGQSRDLAYYLGRPVVAGDLHGQAPLLWFAQQVVRLEK